MSASRNQQHYIIMTVIYNELSDFAMNEGHVFRDARDLTSELCGVPYEEVDNFIKQSIAASLQNYGAIVKAFTPHLKNWTWDRLPLLTRAILVMSYAHFYYVEKVDKGIVIDIAVQLAKTYIEEKQAKFVNAILDKVL